MKGFILALLLPGLAFADFQDPVSDFTKLVKRAAVPLQWDRMLHDSYRMIFIGDSHSVKAIKQELADHMADFKTAGLTHLAVEFGSDLQPLLDSDLGGGWQFRDKVAAALVEQQHIEAASYAQLAFSARRAGLRLVAVDMPKADSDRNWRICENERHKNRNDCWRELVSSREEHMLSRLAKALSAEPTARVAALLGDGHVQSTELPAQLKRRQGIDSENCTFLFREKDSRINTYNLRDALYRAVQSARLAEQRIVLPVQNGAAPYDAIIWVPGLDR